MKYLLSVGAAALEPRHRRIRNYGDAKECQDEQACNRARRERIRGTYRLTFFRNFRRVLILVCRKSGSRSVNILFRYGENNGAFEIPNKTGRQTLSEKHEFPLLRQSLITGHPQG